MFIFPDVSAFGIFCGPITICHNQELQQGVLIILDIDCSVCRQQITSAETEWCHLLIEKEKGKKEPYKLLNW